MAVKFYGQYMVTDTESELLALTPLAGQIGYPMDSKVRLIYNGSAWNPNSAVQILRASSTVNCLATGMTTIYTYPTTSFRFVPLGAHIEVVTTAGTGVLAPSISVGTNSTAFNNMFTSTALSTLLNQPLGSTSPNALTPASSVAPLTSGTVITAKVNVAATGYSQYAVRIDVFGYYET